MSKISYNAMSRLCQRVAQSYKAGLDLHRIWQREAEHGSPAYRSNTAAVASEIGDGEPLWEAMENRDGYFPKLSIYVVKAGEIGGRLEQSFFHLAEHYKKLVEFRSTVIRLIRWPLFQVGISVIVIGALILIMGWITSMGNMDPIDWFGLGWSTNQYFAAYVAFNLTILSAIVVLGLGFARGWFGTAPMRVARRVPLLGKTLELLSLARFAWALGVTINAGMNVVESLKMAVGATQNYYYERLGEFFEERVREGEPIASTLAETDAFPEDFVMNVENGEVSGELPESMDRVSQEYLVQAERNMHTIAGILGGLCFLIVATIIIICIVTLFLKVYLGQLNRFSEM